MGFSNHKLTPYQKEFLHLRPNYILHNYSNHLNKKLKLNCYLKATRTRKNHHPPKTQSPP